MSLCLSVSVSPCVNRLQVCLQASPCVSLLICLSVSVFPCVLNPKPSLCVTPSVCDSSWVFHSGCLTVCLLVCIASLQTLSVCKPSPCEPSSCEAFSVCKPSPRVAPSMCFSPCTDYISQCVSPCLHPLRKLYPLCVVSFVCSLM